MRLRLSKNGYRLSNEYGLCLYTEETGYKRLFQFAHSDINSINEKLEKYMSSMIDFSTMKLISNKPDKELADLICATLQESHPYYNICAKETLAGAIADYLLQLIVLGTLDITKHPELENMFATTYDRSWISERLTPICNFLFPSTTSYKTFEDQVYNKYLAILSGREASHKTPPIAFEKLLLNHSRINHCLYWVLDLSVSDLAGLSIAERKALYDTLFPKTIGEPDLEVNRYLSFTDPRTRELLSKEFMQSDGTYSPAALEIYDYRFYGNSLSVDAKKLLKAQIKKIKGNSEQSLCEEYFITDLFQILFLEVEQMIKNGISIKKCRYCHRYFVVEDKKIEYCNQVAFGETEPCNKIGPARVYKANMEKDYPLKIYERAYGTRYAQYARYSITQEEFNAWCQEARCKLDAVRAGTLSIESFAQWIEETKKLKKSTKKN